VLVDVFGWSVFEIDRTDIESLIPFVLRYPQWKKERAGGGPKRAVFVDQVDWL
jgi:hypothetical protein